MNKSRKAEICNLAEVIANENISNGVVSLEKIAEKNNITFSYGNYGASFLGLLEQKNGEFHIYINLHLLEHEEHPRTRFTFAHELAHFFIKEHNTCLLNGISLSFTNEFSYQSKNIIEQEANIFAANLLLPRKLFEKKISKHDIGMDAILNAKEYFKCSILCTALQFINLDFVPSMIFHWDKYHNYKWKWMSPSFMKRISFTSKMTFLINTTHINNSMKYVEISPVYYEEKSLLENWIIDLKGKAFPIIEQSMDLKKFGGITLIMLI